MRNLKKYTGVGNLQYYTFMSHLNAFQRNTFLKEFQTSQQLKTWTILLLCCENIENLKFRMVLIIVHLFITVHLLNFNKFIILFVIILNHLRTLKNLNVALRRKHSKYSIAMKGIFKIQRGKIKKKKKKAKHNIQLLFHLSFAVDIQQKS